MLCKSMKMNANPGDAGGGGGNSDPLFDNPPAVPPATPPAVPPTVPDPSVPDWQKDWPDELRNAPYMKNFKSPRDVAQSLANAQKLIGADKIAIPKNASKEELVSIFRKLGSPEKFDDFKYELATADSVDKDTLAAINKVAHENGMLPAQAKAVMDEFAKLNSSAQKLYNDNAALKRTNELKALRDEWGDTYANQIARARAAMSEFMNPAEREALQKSGMSGNPVILKLLANAGATLSEDKILGQGGSNVGAPMTPDAARQERTKIMQDFNSPYYKPDHPEHQAVKATVAKLFEYEAGKAPANAGQFNFKT